jgi:NDP-sugar pyrophosphorylase family protein
MQIVIPLSGIGKRFMEAGYTVPKPLIDVDGMPMIEHVVRLFPGENRFIFICNDLHLRETHMREILMRICPSCEIIEVSVKDRQGPVHAVSQAYQAISDEDEVIVSYCDYGTWWDYPAFLKEVRELEADGAIPAYIGFHPHMLGKDHYAYMTHQDRWMQKIQEKKPFTNDKMAEYASNGTYYFKKARLMKHYFNQLMAMNLQLNGEYYVSMVYNLLAQDGLKVRIFEIEHMLQWGTPYDLEVYQMWSSYFKSKLTPLIRLPDQDTLTILPMAGRGSRFSMQGFTTAKPFLEVDGLPMVVQAIQDLPQTKDLTVITLKEHVEQYPTEFKTLQKYFPHMNLEVIQDVTDGQATTCSLVLDNVDDQRPILISACDNGIYYHARKYQQLVDDPNVDVIVWSFTNHPTSKLYPHMYAWLDVDEQDWIHQVSVKKPLVNKENKHAIIGTMLFKQAKFFKEGYNYICQHQIQTNGEYYVDDLLNPLIQMGYRIKVFPVDYYLCWGTPNDYKTYLYWETFFHKCDWHPYQRLRGV